MEELSWILGGKIGYLPTIYLGIPLDAKSKAVNICNPVIEKCEKKLTRWKCQCISLAESLSLIQFWMPYLLTCCPSFLLTIPNEVI